VVLLVGLSATACQDREPSTSPLEPPPSATPASPSEHPSTTRPVSCPHRGGWTIEDPRITESSGLARSQVHPGVLYTHNDRGTPPNLFAIDASGTRAVLRLDATAVDWEDVAITPDAKIWVADLGDNERVRPTVQVNVLDEPDVLVSASVSAATYDFRYPDGPQDAEALLIDPRDDRVYVVTKDLKAGRIYQAPARLDTEKPNLLRYLGAAPPSITGGDFSPKGDRVVLRNQARAFFYDEIGGAPTEMTLPSQRQGESVTFTADGGHVLVGSEGVDSTILCAETPPRGEQ